MSAAWAPVRFFAVRVAAALCDMGQSIRDRRCKHFCQDAATQPVASWAIRTWVGGANTFARMQQHNLLLAGLSEPGTQEYGTIACNLSNCFSCVKEEHAVAMSNDARTVDVVISS